MKYKIRRLFRADALLGVGAVLVLILCIVLTAARYAYQWVDGAWNAQVADVFARTGRYAVSYPHEEAFFVPITTGQTVLLPVALLFRLFGVHAASAAAVPVVYMCAAVTVMLIMLRRFFDPAGAGGVKSMLAAGGVTAFCFFFYSLYGRYAYQVLGEGAALLFLLLACMLLGRYTREKSRASAVLSGALLACALITKTVAVCFLMVFAPLILLECFVTKRFPAQVIFYLAAGFASAFCALEAIKFAELGGGIGAYLAWWKETVFYSFGLSSGGAEEMSFAARVLDNLQAAAGLFAAGNLPALLALLFIAPGCYLVSAGARLMKRKDPFEEPERFALLALGLGGDGFVVASILFASSSMFTERRVLVHGVLFTLFAAALTVQLVRLALESRRALTAACGLVCAAALLCCAPGAVRGACALIQYDQSEDAQRSRDTDVFIEAVCALEDARFYGCGWTFAAESMLFGGIELHNLEYWPPAYDAAKNHYLLVESYPIPYDLSADYALTPVWQLRPGEETYSIYRIEPAHTKE